MLTESGEVTCDECGQVLQVGDHPFCPHGHGGGAAFHDEIPGGIVCENYGPTTQIFYSHSERRAYMKAHGLQEKEKFCPMPGTDIDPQGIPNPAGFMDEVTFANGKALLCRSGAKAEPWDGSGVLTNIEAGSISDMAARMVAGSVPGAIEGE